MRFQPEHLIAILLAAMPMSAAGGAELVQLDPFAQATAGFSSCPPVRPRLVTLEESRSEAHVREHRAGLRRIAHRDTGAGQVRPLTLACGEGASRVREPVATMAVI